MTLDDDGELTDERCPWCRAYTVRSRGCDECDDGWCDEHESDPVNFAPGEEYTLCRECLGAGAVCWCSDCGFDVTRHGWQKSDRAGGQA